MTLKQQIENILRDDPRTRNSDIALTIEVWKRYYREKIGFLDRPAVPAIALESLYDLPREDNVKRIRAKFNAEGKYWPTDLAVAKGRGILEDKWREAMGYPKVEETKHPTRESYTEPIHREHSPQGSLL